MLLWGARVRMDGGAGDDYIVTDDAARILGGPGDDWDDGCASAKYVGCETKE